MLRVTASEHQHKRADVEMVWTALRIRCEKGRGSRLICAVLGRADNTIILHFDPTQNRRIPLKGLDELVCKFPVTVVRRAMSHSVGVGSLMSSQSDAPKHS